MDLSLEDCVFLLFAPPASSGGLGLQSENLENSGVWSVELVKEGSADRQTWAGLGSVPF